LLELEAAGDAETLELDVLEHLYQLPKTDELDRTRPATLFPTRREWSDRTVLRQRFILPIE
jgi:hypothetical protein